VHAATGPNALMNLELTNADMVKLTTANDVNAIPTARVSKFSRFCNSDGKNAKNVLSAA
jgi:Trk K+ transport system NAD-binding subunit